MNAGPGRRLRGDAGCDLASKIGAAQAEIDGAVAISDSLFAKGRYGAVQFDYGRKVAGLAPGYPSAEGDSIARWLRGKLPASAFVGG